MTIMRLIVINFFNRLTALIYILRKGPAHIIQQPTGKTPGAPDGQSATGLIPGAVLGVSGYPGLSPETLIYVSENTGYKSNKTGYAEKLHWLMPSSHCMIFKVIGSPLFSHCTTIWGSSQSLLCSHCTIDRRQEEESPTTLSGPQTTAKRTRSDKIIMQYHWYYGL